MKTKRFLVTGCLAVLLTMALFPSDHALGQGNAAESIPYRIHLHDHLDYNYPLWVPGTGTTVTSANVFKVSAQYGETLEAVGLRTLIKDTRYAVSVVTDFTGTASFERTVPVAQGALADPGYHTIDLDSQLILASGSRFAVVVSQTALSRPAVAADSAKAEAGKGSVSQAGESFVLLSGGWTDLYALHPNTNVCVRAFTWDRPAPEPPKMRAADMEKELEYVLGRMRKDHPKVSTDGFTLSQLDIIASVREKIAEPLSKQDFWFQLQRVFAALREGQTELFSAFGETQYLDLPFRWLMDDGMVVTQDAGDLLKGDQIQSIGGRLPEDLIAMLWGVTSSENEYWVRHSAQSLLQRGSYLSYLGITNADQTVDVEVLRDGKTTVHCIPLTRTRAPVPAKAVVAPWRIEKEHDLGYLRFDDFPPQAELAPVAVMIDDFFDAVRRDGIRNIVLDLRNTNGRSSWIIKTILSYIDTGQMYENGYQRVHIPRKAGVELFNGGVYALTSNRTFGATVIFASLLQDNGVAVLVGEPTGQMPAFNAPTTSGEKLPVTGWQFRLGTQSQVRARNRDASEIALFPDIPAHTSRLDLLSGTDTQLEALRAAIKSHTEAVAPPAAKQPAPVEDWSSGSLPQYIASFSYVERFHYFIVVFKQPITALNPQGITVTGAAGNTMELRSAPNLSTVAVDTLTIAPRDWVTEAEACVITLPAGAIVLSDGLTNTATLTLRDYEYHQYP